MTYAYPVAAYDKDGKRRLLRPGEVLEDGEHLPFSIHLMDGQRSRDVSAEDVARAVHDAEIADAYSEMLDHLHNAWRRPDQRQPEQVADAAETYEDAYARLVDDLTNAWKR